MHDRSAHTTLGAGGEFDRIRAIWRQLGARGTSLGDDAALVSVGGTPLAMSTDMMVEGQHFRLAWLSPVEIGWRAAAGALSDLAAVAATPAGVLASIGVPEGRSDAFLEDLMIGIGAAAEEVGAVVWGGDIVRSGAVVIDLACVGLADRPVRRSTATVGDQLFVTGRLGGPAAAVNAWRAGDEPRPDHRERFARPVPRVWEAQWLRDGGASAMIDVSDGLVGDAGHLAAASDVCCVVDVDRIPLAPGVTTWDQGAASGEEFELLLSGRGLDPDAFAAEFAIPLTTVGRIEAGAGVRFQKNGTPIEPPPGYSHFA